MWNIWLLTDHILSISVTVDLLPLTNLHSIFEQHDMITNDRTMDVTEIINCLATVYENLAVDHPSLVNVPQCVDMCLNWLLNVYDT